MSGELEASQSSHPKRDHPSARLALCTRSRAMMARQSCACRPPTTRHRSRAYRAAEKVRPHGGPARGAGDGVSICLPRNVSRLQATSPPARNRHSGLRDPRTCAVEVATRPASVKETASTRADAIEAGDTFCEWTVASPAALAKTGMSLPRVVCEHGVALRCTRHVDKLLVVHEIVVEDRLSDGLGAQEFAEDLALLPRQWSDPRAECRAVVDGRIRKELVLELACVGTVVQDMLARLVRNAVSRGIESIDQVSSVSQVGQIAP